MTEMTKANGAVAYYRRTIRRQGLVRIYLRKPGWRGTMDVDASTAKKIPAGKPITIEQTWR